MVAPVERPLARALQHFNAGRIPEARGAFNAVLRIDPTQTRAYFGLANCAATMGRADQGADYLIQSGRNLAGRGRADVALALFSHAVTLDPTRLEVHVDIAELEAEAGQVEAATTRLEQLAEAYVDAGALDEARDVLEFVEALSAAPEPEPEPIITPVPQPRLQPQSSPVLRLVESALLEAGVTASGVVVSAQTGTTRPLIIDAARPPGTPQAIVQDHTVVAQTVLLFPDGTPMPNQTRWSPPGVTTPVRRGDTASVLSRSSRVAGRPARPRRPLGGASFRVKPPPEARNPKRAQKKAQVGPPPATADNSLAARLRRVSGRR